MHDGLHADLTERIVRCAIEVHRHLGPGLLESVYEICIAYELTRRGVRVERQVPIPVEYRGVLIDVGYKMDILVEDAVLVEVKSVERLGRIHSAQVLTYLKLSGLRLGLLINFNVNRLIDGVRRLVIDAKNPGTR